MHFASRRLAVVCAGLLGLSALATTLTVIPADAVGETTADDTPPPIVETYDYPGADRILAERNITLLKGDGRVLLVDCVSGGDLIVVQSYKIKGGDACFRVTGTPGYVTMQIPETYFIKGDSHTSKATLTAKSTTETVDIRPGQWTPVGEALPNHDPAALLEIRVTA
ncbi:MULTISPECIES: hypothetical protein [Amycolatopsis]|uniref:hypothetical protein n=1 Tax=Amycolatopsis TaxID=1813 RepID=UPI001C56506A|nr:hypothetical protein [Amycolatopsis sp. TNS106]QXV59290.1 hypothetical protein CVV72_21325 [Amycolatopsis sp. TNS106]